METIEYHCKKVLKLIRENYSTDNSNYSTVRISKNRNDILEQINNNIDFSSLARNFVDDTGKYDDFILTELEIIYNKIEMIKG